MTRRLAVLALCLLTGCGGYVAFAVDSIPQGANVFVGSQQIGTTPMKTITWQTTEPSVPVTLELMNHKPMTFLVPAQVTFETEELAREKAYDYRFVLQERRP